MARIYPQRVLGHWDKFAEGLRISTLAFYDTIEETMATREIAGAEVARVAWPEGGVFSPRRHYLQVSFDTVVFVASAIPSGNSTYFSWWLGLSDRGLISWLSNLRYLGWLFRPLFRPLTFYRIDSVLAFEHTLHAVVLESIDQLTNAKGVRCLDVAERKPVMWDLLERRP